MKLHEKLICLRKVQGLSQFQLAEILNVSRQSVSKWENGTVAPSAENMKVLGDLYGVSLEYLLNDALELPVTQVPDPPAAPREQGRKNRIILLVAVAVLIVLTVSFLFYLYLNREENTQTSMYDAEMEQFEDVEDMFDGEFSLDW